MEEPKSGSIEIVTGNTSTHRSGTVQLMTGVTYDVFSGKISFLSEKLTEHQESTERMVKILNPPPLKERIKDAVYKVVRFLP